MGHSVLEPAEFFPHYRQGRGIFPRRLLSRLLRYISV